MSKLFILGVMASLLVLTGCNETQGSNHEDGFPTVRKAKADLISRPAIVPVSERPSIMVTGNEILKFSSGPCFQLNGLRALGPKRINVNRPTAQKPINFSTLSPIKFVDGLPEESDIVSAATPVHLITFDTNLTKLGFDPLPDHINELYRYGSDRFLVHLGPTSGRLADDNRSYKPRAMMDLERWRELASGTHAKINLPSSVDPAIEFFASISGKFNTGQTVEFEDLESENAIALYGYDFDNHRLVEVRSSAWAPRLTSLVGIDRPGFPTSDQSARLFQYLQNGKLHSEFAVGRDYVLQSNEIFEAFNKIVSNAMVSCDSSED